MCSSSIICKSKEILCSSRIEIDVWRIWFLWQIALLLPSDNCVRFFFADRERTSSGNSNEHKKYYVTYTYIRSGANEPAQPKWVKWRTFRSCVMHKPSVDSPTYGYTVYREYRWRPFDRYAGIASWSCSSWETVITQCTKRSGSNRLFAGTTALRSPLFWNFKRE